MKVEEILATLIINAFNIREASYDSVACNQKVSKEKPGSCIDFNKFYRVSLLECAKMACVNEVHLEDPVYQLISGVWPEARNWAETIISRGKSGSI